jgi:hypothetical protein
MLGLGSTGTVIALKAGMLTTILMIILVLALLGAVPAWPHSRDWGYGPSGAVGTIRHPAHLGVARPHIERRRRSGHGQWPQ